MPSELNLPDLQVLSSHLKISTHLPLATLLARLLRHRPSLTTGQGAEPTPYNKHRQAHLHGEARNHHRSPCLAASKNGSLPRHLVGHPVLSKSILGKRIVAAEQIAQSVRPMFWKCLTIPHGANRLEGVSLSGGAVSVREDLYMNAKDKHEQVSTTSIKLAWCGFGNTSSQNGMVQDGVRYGVCCMNVWNDWIRKRLASTQHATIMWN